MAQTTAHPHSALHLYNFLCAIRSTFSSADEYQQEFESVLLAPRYTPELFNGVVTLLQGVMSMSATATTTERATFWPELQHIMQAAHKDPHYDSLLSRVTESFFFIRHVDSVLNNDNQLEAFIRSLLLDYPDAQHAQVMESIAGFLATLDSTTRAGVESVLNDQRHSSAEQGSPDHLLRIRRILDDDALFMEFKDIVDTDTVAGVPWNDTLLKLYGLIRLRKPEVWESISYILDQAQAAHDTTQYSSYEEYVQKNFLEDGGQQYLDSEIDRARVESMLDSLTM
ncbi:hypothetical protein BDB00DRAFT_870933 [Zychaea mexicana]|uniref:uncharacterized protein n=1 Tax=Zychaea mexicana TaxID=64656 RepID=UPI0022FDC2E0|nr:uncharacterized protein BDB00DRAFT_870933 [Zychaea mexicana]KAI9494945.1 hypothetical protein BDB00DRAFT_870933 [Zychaea mexicana]